MTVRLLTHMPAVTGKVETLSTIAPLPLSTLIARLAVSVPLS